MWTHYRWLPLVQGGVKTFCNEVTVEMSPTLKNTQPVDRLMELMKTLCSEPHPPIILGSFLADELEVEFLSNETGQKSLKTRKEVGTKEKGECNKIIRCQRYIQSSRSEEATSWRKRARDNPNRLNNLL